MKLQLFGAVCAAIFVSGCVRTSVMPVAADTVQISTRAAEVCGAEGAQRVAFLQAAVETIRRGYDRFVILGAQESASTEVVGMTPVVANTYGDATANTFGNTTYASGTATTTLRSVAPRRSAWSISGMATRCDSLALDALQVPSVDRRRCQADGRQ